MKDKQYTVLSSFFSMIRHEIGFSFLENIFIPIILPEMVTALNTKDNEIAKNKLLDAYKFTFSYNEINESNQTFINILENGIEYKKINVKDYLLKLIMLLEKRVRSKGLQYNVSFQDVDYIVNHCDINLLGLIIDNIIGNAIKYTKEGFINAYVYYGKDKKDTNSLMIKIVDSGIGIPKEELHKVRSKGYRASNVGKIKGTGLGLSTVSPYTSLMRGNLKIESQENVGTTVILSFPITGEKTLLINEKNQSVDNIYNSINTDSAA